MPIFPYLIYISSIQPSIHPDNFTPSRNTHAYTRFISSMTLYKPVMSFESILPSILKSIFLFMISHPYIQLYTNCGTLKIMMRSLVFLPVLCAFIVIYMWDTSDLYLLEKYMYLTTALYFNPLFYIYISQFNKQKFLKYPDTILLMQHLKPFE